MRKLTLAAAALCLLVATQASAQQYDVPASASITIPTVIYMDVTNTTVTFPAPSASDFEAGSIAASSAPSEISTRSNVPHDVSVATSGGATEMSFVPANGTDVTSKPADDLEFDVGGAGSWAGISDVATDVVTGLSRGRNDAAATVTYRMLLDYGTDAPGTYTLAFVYSAVAN